MSDVNRFVTVLMVLNKICKNILGRLGLLTSIYICFFVFHHLFHLCFIYSMFISNTLDKGVEQNFDLTVSVV